MSIIMKFGGTSVANAKAINQVVSIIRRQYHQKPVVITSALAGITDLLLQTAHAAVAKKYGVVKKNLMEIRERHMAVAQEFSLHVREETTPAILTELQELTEIFGRIRNRALSKQQLDGVASFGERLASWLVAGALLSQKIPAQRVDSRELVVTDSNFGSAEVDFKKTQRKFSKKIAPLIRHGVIPVITGFIGQDSHGHTTTLGRGGSDYSGAIAAVCLRAKEIQIWKDVKGFMTADPRMVSRAHVIPMLSFREAAELSFFGAKLLHPKTIHPAIAENIPVRILNTFAPDDPGTIIYGEARARRSRSQKMPVRAIAYKKGVTVINVCSLRMLGPYGFLEKLFRIFANQKVPVDVVSTSEVSVSVTIEDKTYSPDLVRALAKIGTVEVRRDHVILSLVGVGLKNDPRVEANIFEVLRRVKIPTEMISKGASAINFTCIIEEKFCDRAVKALHQKFFS